MNTNESIHSMLGQSPAEHAGYILGMIIGIVFFLGVAVVAVFCIVKAFTKKSNGWILAGCIGSAVLAAPLTLVFTGLVSAFFYAAKQNGSTPGFSRMQSGSKATQIVHGRDLAYTLHIPAAWRSKTGVENFDTLSVYHSLAVGVVAEEANMGSPEKMAEMALGRFKKMAADVQSSEPEPITIDGHSWLQFTVDCEISKVPFTYQYYVYAGPEGSFQVIGWTTHDLFSRDVSLMRDTMQTFRFPKGEAMQKDTPDISHPAKSSGKL